MCTDNEGLENKYSLKRKINNIENIDIPNNEKNLKDNNQDRISYQEHNYNQLSFEIGEYFRLGKSDSNFLFQKIKEFEGFCVNDLYIFSNTCTEINIIDDIVNGRFISTYKLLIQALTGEREGTKDLKIPNSETILNLLVYLKKIYSVEEFYHIKKHLSEIYKHPNFKKKYNGFINQHKVL